MEVYSDADDEDGGPDANRLISWGCGAFGQHCHAHTEDVSIQDGLLDSFTERAKFVACGASHTIVVSSRWYFVSVPLLEMSRRKTTHNKWICKKNFREYLSNFEM